MHNPQNLLKDKNMVPTLFHEIYKKHFGASHDSTQESTWHWLTNQNIWHFSALVYTRDDLLHVCTMKCKGHKPKMFLWMLEEYVYILDQLHEDNRDGCVVLGYELLLVACSRCCSKRGGGRGLHCPCTLCWPFTSLPHRHPGVCCACIYGHHILGWSTWHGQYMIISWHLGNHHLAMQAMAKCYNAWWTMHTEDYICIVWCAPQPYSNQKGDWSQWLWYCGNHCRPGNSQWWEMCGRSLPRKIRQHTEWRPSMEEFTSETENS